MSRSSKLKPPKRIKNVMQGWGPWEDISTRQAIDPEVKHLFVGAWRNHVYSVRIYRGHYPAFEGVCLQLSIMHRDEKPGIPWWIKMVIKHQLAGSHLEAVEVYPASKDIVDPSNIYYLVCLPEGVSLGLHMQTTDKYRAFQP